MRFVVAVMLSMMATLNFADEVKQKFDEDVLAFMKGKISEVEADLKIYHAVKDKLSEKPIGAYEDFFDENKFKTFSDGIKQRVREHKLYSKFMQDGFVDISEVNGTLKGYLMLKAKTEADDKKAKELLMRKRNLGKLAWAKCENDMKIIDGKSYRKLRDAYWKMVEKYFKKYRV